jgi:rRNA processing protein Gar1
MMARRVAMVARRVDGHDVFGPVADVFGPVADIFGPVADVFGPVADVFGPVADIFGPVADVFGPVADVFGPVADVGKDPMTTASAYKTPSAPARRRGRVSGPSGARSLAASAAIRRATGAHERLDQVFHGCRAGPSQIVRSQ